MNIVEMWNSPFLHNAQIANAVTGFATVLAGLVPLALCLVTRMHPPRWMFVYLCIFITGVPTVGFHAFEQSAAWASWDVGTNILLAYSMQLAACYDFRGPEFRRWFIPTMTVLNACAWVYLALRGAGYTEKFYLISIGDNVHFTISEIVLITNSWVVAFFFFRHWRDLPRHSRPLIAMVIFMFFIGMLLASASNGTISYRVVAWHALWHIWGAFALLTLWLFNFVRFHVPDGYVKQGERHAGA